MKLLNPEETPDISGTAGSLAARFLLRWRKNSIIRTTLSAMEPSAVPTLIPTFALVLKLVAVGVRVSDGPGMGVLETVEDVVVTSKDRLRSDARDAAYALGKSVRSLDCQYTTTEAAAAIPDVSVVGLLSLELTRCVPTLVNLVIGDVTDE
jgi:hypothetical protein